MTNDQIVRTLKDFGDEFGKMRRPVMNAWQETTELRNTAGGCLKEHPEMFAAFGRSGQAGKEMLAWLETVPGKWPWVHPRESLTRILSSIAEDYGVKPFDEDAFVYLESEYNSEADHLVVAFMSGLLDQIQ